MALQPTYTARDLHNIRMFKLIKFFIISTLIFLGILTFAYTVIVMFELNDIYPSRSDFGGYSLPELYSCPSFIKIITILGIDIVYLCTYTYIRNLLEYLLNCCLLCMQRVLLQWVLLQ